MLEHIAAALAGTFMLGMATWHAARLVVDGKPFAPLRDELEHAGYSFSMFGERVLRQPGTGRVSGFFRLLHEGVTCRLCTATWVASLFTWGALAVGLVVRPSELPPAEWGFALAVGPFLTAAWAELLRRLEG